MRVTDTALDFDFSQEIVYHTGKAGTLYGIHFQNAPKAQTKLLYCIQGRGLNYAADPDPQRASGTPFWRSRTTRAT